VSPPKRSRRRKEGDPIVKPTPEPKAPGNRSEPARVPRPVGRDLVSAQRKADRQAQHLTALVRETLAALQHRAPTDRIAGLRALLVTIRQHANYSPELAADVQAWLTAEESASAS
jgi:hypothetical protein